MNENTSISRIDRLADEPWLAEVSDIVTLAERKGLTLTASDVKGPSGDHVIDGMEWYEWLDAMTQDDEESTTKGCDTVGCKTPTTQPLYRVTAYGKHATVTVEVTQLPSDREAAYGPRHTIERIR